MFYFQTLSPNIQTSRKSGISALTALQKKIVTYNVLSTGIANFLFHLIFGQKWNEVSVTNTKKKTKRDKKCRIKSLERYNDQFIILFSLV